MTQSKRHFLIGLLGGVLAGCTALLTAMQAGDVNTAVIIGSLLTGVIAAATDWKAALESKRK